MQREPNKKQTCFIIDSEGTAILKPGNNAKKPGNNAKKPHTCTSMFMRHSSQLFGKNVGTQFGCSWQQSGEALNKHVQAQAARELQCRSQAITPRLSG
jgi:hypothetical protein